MWPPTIRSTPSSGESIVKRPDCGGRFNPGEVLRSKGYITRFLYGGDSYFDNMGAFFSGNGYEVVDRGDYLPGEITFANIWGTCDEDSYNVALRLCDADYAAGKPFFTQIMTISNHRPYTYPEGRITYEGNPMSRRAAVKYTDYAIGDFFAKAAQKPWFAETVFATAAAEVVPALVLRHVAHAVAALAILVAVEDILSVGLGDDESCVAVVVLGHVGPLRGGGGGGGQVAELVENTSAACSHNGHSRQDNYKSCFHTTSSSVKSLMLMPSVFMRWRM